MASPKALFMLPDIIPTGWERLALEPSSKLCAQRDGPIRQRVRSSPMVFIPEKFGFRGSYIKDTE
jgi:hypothetical protein